MRILPTPTPRATVPTSTGPLPHYVMVETAKGSFTIQLFIDPNDGVQNVVRNFADKARGGYYDGLTFDTIVSPDGLHLNDWSYACFAKWLGRAITEASMRPLPTATAPRLEP